MMCIGQKVLFQGAEVEIVAKFSPQDWVVLGTNMSYGLVVPEKQLKALATDTFNVGDVVQGLRHFTGVVTGFEHETNRVVCRSAHEQDRRRYSYAPYELTLLARRGA